MSMGSPLRPLATPAASLPSTAGRNDDDGVMALQFISIVDESLFHGKPAGRQHRFRLTVDGHEQRLQLIGIPGFALDLEFRLKVIFQSGVNVYFHCHPPIVSMLRSLPVKRSGCFCSSAAASFRLQASSSSCSSSAMGWLLLRQP